MKPLLGAGAVGVGLCVLTWLVTPGSSSPEPSAEGGYVDMHVHIGCMGFGDSGCFLSPELRDGYKFGFYLKAFATSLEQLIEHGDDVVVDTLSENIAASTWVEKAVVLGLDGVIGPDGQLDESRTQVYVPDGHVYRSAARHDNLIPGPSINPNRKDALKRLDRAKHNGAALVKWIPCIMEIDPSDEGLIPFYQKLVALDLPLLSHAG